MKKILISLWAALTQNFRQRRRSIENLGEVTISLDPTARNGVKYIMDVTEIRDVGGVFSQALTTLHVFAEFTQKNYKIFIRRPDGTEEEFDVFRIRPKDGE